MLHFPKTSLPIAFEASAYEPQRTIKCLFKESVHNFVAPPCDPGWVKTPSDTVCIKEYDNLEKTWYDARRACQSVGGDLVTIRDNAMSNFIEERDSMDSVTGKSFWIGLHNLPADDRWHWLDEDKTPTYTNWFSAAPVWDPSESKERCAYIATFLFLWTRWNVSNCIETMPYICEKPLAFPCPRGWVKTPSGEACVRSFGDPVGWRLPWRKARWVCQKLGGDFVTIRDNSTLNFIRDRIVATKSFPSWVGYHKLIGEDRWHWLDENGAPTTWNWGDWHPDQTTEECAAVSNASGQETPWQTYNIVHSI
ncbi:macrophage mannose receptor 1-like [Plakobranchus ocellatus]|uniref:Macrophage mannose receptor 1-like n=1 Tax=Plakobranchus ocellatus TaxID=259542 RepID=A0AAV4BD33_9GAST|nr:macrophage mannose receptor 1-like [Plakobranchus ocellatus]